MSLCQLFCEWLSIETNVCFQLTPDQFKLNFFDNSDNSKAFHTVLIKIRTIHLQKSPKIWITC